MNGLALKSKLFLKHNSSTILTIIGAAGVVVTAVTAVKATPKALALLEDAKEEKGEELTKLEKVKVAAPVYIPSTVIGVSTIVCMFGANMISKRQQASLMSAYALLDSAYKEYQIKVKDIFGEEASNQIRHEIVKERMEDAVGPDDDEKKLFFDWYSMRYFESTESEVLEAEREFNDLFQERGWVCLNEWYECLDIPTVDYGEEVGWSKRAAKDTYGYNEIEFDYEFAQIDNNLEAIIITMPFEPTNDYIWY